MDRLSVDRPRASGGATRAAIEHHYDVGTEFFRLWLDPLMVYSCGLWTSELDDDLESAQRAKLRWHASVVGADGAAQILDVGCGWGAMLHYLTAEHGVGHVTGLTLSSDQASSIEQSVQVEVRLEDWRDHLPSVPYDAIVSIGSFEHFARHDLDGPDRLAIYASFFESCAGWLVPGGRLSVQTIAYEDFDPATGPISTFFTDEIFPESSLPRLGEIVVAAEPWFRLVAFRSDGEQYEHTLHLWQQRLEAQADAATDLVGRATYRRYLRFLRLSRAMFDRRVCTLYRLAFERRPVAAGPSVALGGSRDAPR